jgi:hypothetical protein
MRDPVDAATRDIETGAFLIGYARVSTRDQDLTNQEPYTYREGDDET